MVEEWVSIWKLLSLLFFIVLFFFLVYASIERLLTKLEFKRNLRLVKDQLFFDIFKNDNIDASEFLDIDELSSIEVDSRQKLKDLKKEIFCDISKYNLKDLQKRISLSSVEKEKKINKLVLTKYKDAIKSLNNKILYLKSDLDAVKAVFSNNIDYYNNTANTVEGIASSVYESTRDHYVKLNSSISDVEKSLENKIDYIFKDKNDYMHKYIDHIVKTNDKIIEEKVSMIMYLQTKNESLMRDIVTNSDRMTEEKIKMLMSAQSKNEEFMKENIKNVYSLLQERDAKMEVKDQFISEQKSRIFDLENKMAKQSEL